MSLKRVTVHLYSQAKPLKYESVQNAYTKGPLYCIMTDANTVHKFPLEHVFRIVEES